MKVLFISSPNEDYLADSLLLGFRKVFGENCVDYPKAEILYEGCPQAILDQVRGKGFTLYTGLLKDIFIDRYGIEEKIKSGYYHVIVFGDIQRQFGLFVQYRPWLTNTNTLIFDGADTVQPYPARGHWWRRPYYWFLPKAHKKFLYFKRELMPETGFSLALRFLPLSIQKFMAHPRNLKMTAFSFPEEKIIVHLPAKSKNFPKHIVDSEIAQHIDGSYLTYAFDNEAAYYQDLQDSRFGITTKRAGWDCLRHYEIAANGAVICFRNLRQKPITCAPHGLIHLVNCISYDSFEDLMYEINKLSDEDYNKLQSKSLEWVRSNSCTNRVHQIMTLVR